MPYRVNARKKVVEINGDVDLATIWAKVQAKGGPEGWKISTYITAEQVQHIGSMLAMGEDEDDATEGIGVTYRPVGFRLPSGPYEPGIETGLPYHDLHEPDEE